MAASRPAHSRSVKEHSPVVIGGVARPSQQTILVLVAAGLVAATLAVYGEIGNNEFFNVDDDTYIRLNPHVRSGLSDSNMAWALTAFHAGNWHPMTWLSLQLDAQLFGRNPAGYHWINVLFHIANAVLLFGWLQWLTGALWRSAWVAALFALHPLHVESVAWVAERKDVLSTFFWMLTIIAYTWYARHPAWGRYGLVMLGFALGLMAKTMLVTLPFVLLLLDYWPLSRWRFGPAPSEIAARSFAAQSHARLLAEKLPLLALAAGASIVTISAQTQASLVQSFDEVPFGDRVANAVVSYIRYIGMMFWPMDLAAYYPHPRDTLPLWQALAAGCILVLVSIIVLKAGRRRPYLPVGWFWYLGTLVPVIGLVQVGTQALADRYTYVPLIGLFVVVVWRVTDWWLGRDLPEVILAAFAGFTLALLMLVSWLQVRYWADSITMWMHTLHVTKNNYVAHSQVGLAYLNHGFSGEALPHFQEAARLRPDLPDMHCGVGAALFQQGKLKEARAQFEAALALAPRNSKTQTYLGTTDWRLGKIEQAIEHLTAAIEIDPRQIDAHLALAMIYENQGNSEAAARHLALVREIDPAAARGTPDPSFRR
jgi:hypothetical protein